MIRGERWVGEGPEAVADEAARRFVAAVQGAIAERGRAVVALAGGSTPRATYERLARAPWRDQVDWQRVEIFWSDERSVPPDHPDSNYGMAARALVDHVPVDRARVHRLEGERDDADTRYEAELAHVFGGPARFDLCLLGLGPDGHTASLFPHTPALDEKARAVVKNRVDKLQTDRFTFTAPLINESRLVMITAVGAEKAPVVRAISDENEDPAEHPVLLVRPSAGELVWLFDRAAVG
jgi:6-phosphogluconolactonase